MEKNKKVYWDFSCFFDGDDDPKIEENKKIVKQKSYDFINKWKDREDYLKEPAILQEALEDYEEWVSHYGTGGDFAYYFSLRSAQDQNDTELKAKENRADDFSQKISNDARFFGMRIAKIPESEQKKFLEFEGLKKYKHHLENSFAEAKYLLSEKEENILSLESKASFSNWVNMVESFLSKEDSEIITEEGKKEKKNFSEILSLTNSKNKETRDSAGQAFNQILKKHSDVAEHEMNSILQSKKVDDELRGIERPDLGRHISDDVDSEMVDTLIEAVSEKFNVAKDFYELKSKLMGVDKLEYHERNVPYGEIDKKYSYEDATNLVLKVFKNLDQKFLEIYEGFIKNGQIDSHPKKGKSDGAFCAHNLISQPTYILLNHTDRLKDVLTIAHEVGHGINNELMREKQNALNFGTPMSTAEVASTFMEDFVLEDILKEADDELRLTIMMDKLNNDISTIFRQVACYKFEQDIHKDFREKGYLSKEEIGKLFQKNMSAYMGDFVEQSEGSENWWVYWSHIRRFFYVYSYASGLLISKSMQNSVKENPEFIEDVKEFLSAGVSDSPKNIFKKMGIDIMDKSFWEKGIKEIETLLKETEDLAKKLGKI
ncbi:M3 family oligoendopeptidase [Patescibacteria group bacterium]|nr:M3 family oligoendopeptidase [Patescibacteria group bacterium]